MISAHLLPPLLDKWCSGVVAKQTRLTDKPPVMCQRNKKYLMFCIIIIMPTLTLFDTIWHWMEFWWRRGTLISYASVLLAFWVRDPGQRLRGIGQFWSLVSLDCTHLGPREPGPNYYFVVKKFCFSDPPSTFEFLSLSTFVIFQACAWRDRNLLSCWSLSQ